MPRRVSRVRPAAVALLLLAIGHAVSQSPAPRPVPSAPASPDIDFARPTRAEGDVVAIEFRILAVPPELSVSPQLAEALAGGGRPIRLDDSMLGATWRVASTGSGPGGRPIRLDDTMLRALLEAIQGDMQASTLYSLKVTAASGQRCAVHVDGAEGAGFELSVLPTVSADRRAVRVAFKAKLVPVKHSFVAMRPKGQANAVNDTFTAPEGRTAVFYAGERTQEVWETSKVPVLGDVPFLGWLFTKESKRQEDERILILVMPRVLRR